MGVKENEKELFGSIFYILSPILSSSLQMQLRYCTCCEHSSPSFAGFVAH